MGKIHIEKGSVQETLIIPLYARKLCAEQFPALYQDEYAAKICESIDYDFSKIEAKKNSAMYQFGGLEGAMREKDMIWEITDYLKEFVKEDTEVFDKVTFGSDGLYNYLDNHGHEFDVIELVGVCTDICVIANAVLAKTACPNAHIVVDASLCAGVTPESHETALKAMESLQIEVTHKGEEIWKHIDLTNIQ